MFVRNSNAEIDVNSLYRKNTGKITMKYTTIARSEYPFNLTYLKKFHLSMSIADNGRKAEVSGSRKMAPKEIEVEILTP